MFSISIRRTPFRDALLAIAFGGFGILLQLACGGGGGGGSSTPPAPASPVITSFAPAKTPITAGTSTTLTAVFSNGTGSVDKGVGAVTSGTAVTVSPVADTTYTLSVTNAAGTTATATASIAVLPAPVPPVITAPALVTANQGGYIASVPAQPGATFAWIITNGTLTSATNTPSVTFTAGATGTVSLGCTATNALGATSAVGTASSAIVAAPVDTSLVAATNPVPFGGATTLTPTFSGGTGTVDQGVGSVTSGTPFGSGAITVPKTFTLTVTNASGSAASTQVTLTTQLVSVGVVSPASPTRTAGTSTTFTATATGGATNGLTWSASAGTMVAGTGVWTAPAAAGTVTITATSADDPTKSATTTVTVLALPTAPVITTPAFVTSNQAGYAASTPSQPGMTLAWTITNGTLTAAPTAANITFTAGATGTVGLSCTATNAVGVVSTAGSASSSIVALPTTPVITSPANVGSNQAGYAASVAAQVGSAYAWTLTNGTVTGGAGTTSITFTAGGSGTMGLSCIVTNAAGTASTAGTASSTIFPVPATPVIVAPGLVTSGQAGYVASVPAQASASYAWTLTNGTVTGGAGTTSITFTAGGSGTVGLSCIVTNAASIPSAAGTASSTIVAAPTLPVLTAPANVTSSLAGYTASVPAQATGSTYAWTVTNGTVTAGAGAASITFTAGASGTVGFSCVVTNAAGTVSAAGTTGSAIVPAPTTPVITAPVSVTMGQGGYLASVPAQQAGSSYAWTLTNGTVTAGTGTPTITFSAGASGTVGFRCVVTNAASTPSTAGTASSGIVPFPTISLLSASPTDVVSGGASTLSCTFSGGTGILTPGSIALAAPGGTTVVHPGSTTTYTLTVTNPAGTTTTDTVTVTVGASASISAFKAASSTITTGQGTLLSFTFVGDGLITPGNIPVTTGTQLAVFPTVTTTYMLTTTSSLGGTPATATVPITVKAYTGKFVYVARSGGGISGYSLNDATGVLTELGNSPFDDTVDALHVTSDAAGKFLFVVNGDGLANLANTLRVYKIDPTTGDLTDPVTGIGPNYPVTATAYATGPNPWTSAVDPSGKYVYVRCAGSISAFSLNSTTGVLLPLGTPSYATAGGTGEVLIHPSGQYLFTVGRSSDQLQVFNLNVGTGALSLNASYAMATSTGPLALALNHSGDYLFTKNEGPDATAQECFVYPFYVDIQTGGLTPLAGTDTGLVQADAFHGVSANPTQSVIYITLATSDNDYAAYALNLSTGVLTPQAASTYALFGGTGSDNSLTVSRKGNWGFMTNYNSGQLAVGAIDPTTGVLTAPVFVNMSAGSFPVSVTVVGTVQ